MSSDLALRVVTNPVTFADTLNGAGQQLLYVASGLGIAFVEAKNFERRCKQMGANGRRFLNTAGMVGLVSYSM